MTYEDSLTDSKGERNCHMRQAARRGVAPLNENPKWPEGYFAVLRESGAQEKTIPW
jgi:hypothetical protein